MYRSSIGILAFGILVMGVVPMSASQAATWTVQPDGSGDFPTIQTAVNAATDGDVIALAPGTFTGPGNTNVNFFGRAITIGSATGNAADAVIDCEAGIGINRRGFSIRSGEGFGTVLENVTVTGGYGFSGPGIPGGGALLIANGSSPVIRGCLFVDNHAGMTWDHAGGAVYVDFDCAPVFEDCEFRDNSAYFGGAVGVNHWSTAEFINCRFLDNTAGRGGAIWGNSTSKTCCLFARNNAEQGGAIWGNGFNAELSQSCTYFGNSAGEGGAIFAASGYNAPVTVVDTIIAGCPQGEAIWANSGVTVQISCSDLFGNAGGDWTGDFADQVEMDGNFSADPCFCGPDMDDFQLCADSWCLPGHHPWGCEQLVGAYGQGCEECSCTGPVAVDPISLGGLKSLYR